MRISGLSVIFIVRNESARITDAVSDARAYAGELIVFDQSSDDDTAARALRAGADRVIVVANMGACEPTRPDAIAAARGPWLLFLDADETLAADFKATLSTLLATDADFIRLRRVTTVDGHVIEDAFHDRLFRKGFGIAPAFDCARDALHRGIEPAPRARVVAPNRVAIIHAKSRAEQLADDERYRVISGG